MVLETVLSSNEVLSTYLVLRQKTEPFYSPFDTQQIDFNKLLIIKPFKLYKDKAAFF